MTIVRRTIALLLFVAFLVVACQPEGQVFETTLQTDANKPLQVALTDATKLVTGITQAAANSATTGNDPAVRADEGHPTGLILTWLGGGCDRDASVRFGPREGGFVLSVATHSQVGLGCPAIGVPRAIRIATVRAIPVDSIIVMVGLP